MSISQLTATISAPVNEGVSGLATALQAWLAAHPNIDIQDADHYRPQSTFAADQMRIRLAYTQSVAPSVGAQWASALYRTSGGLTAQQRFNTAMQSAAFVPFFVLDVTNHERARNDSDSIIVIGVATDESVLGLVGHSRAAFIGQPSAPIAVGASQSCPLIDASGRSLGSAPVRNVGAVPWPADQRNYVVFDESSGELIGVPPCAGAAAPIAPVSSTTTTQYPCPAYLPGAQAPSGLPATAVRVPTGAGFVRSTAGVAPGGNLGDFSFGMWMRRDSQPVQYNSFLTFDSTVSPGGANSYFWFGHDSLAGGGLRGLSIYGNNGSHSLNLLPAFGVWVHVAITKTGPNVRGYQNGVLVDWDTGGTVVNIGQTSYTLVDVCKLLKEGGGDDFDGAVRAMFFRASAMTQAEIQAAMIKSDPLTSGVASYMLTGPTDLIDSLGGESLVAIGPAMSTTTGPSGITQP